MFTPWLSTSLLPSICIKYTKQIPRNLTDLPVDCKRRVSWFDWQATVAEPGHDKTNKVSVHPAKTQISLGIRPVWSVFAVRLKKARILSYPLSAQRRLWSGWADAKADLSFRWAHTYFVGVIMSWLNCVWEKNCMCSVQLRMYMFCLHLGARKI